MILFFVSFFQSYRDFFLNYRRSPQRPEAYQGPSNVQLSVTLVNEFQPLTNVRTPFFMWRLSKISFYRHCEIRKHSQKYEQRPCKNCEKVYFLWNETSRLSNEETRFISFKICPVFLELVTHFQRVIKIPCFLYSSTQLTGF